MDLNDRVGRAKAFLKKSKEAREQRNKKDIERMTQRNAEMAEARAAVAKARALRPKSKKTARIKCWSKPKGNPKYTTCYDTKTKKQLRRKTTVPRRPPKPPPPPSRETQMNILKNFDASKYVFY